MPVLVCDEIACPTGLGSELNASPSFEPDGGPERRCRREDLVARLRLEVERLIVLGPPQVEAASSRSASWSFGFRSM